HRARRTGDYGGGLEGRFAQCRGGDHQRSSRTPAKPAWLGEKFFEEAVMKLELVNHSDGIEPVGVEVVSVPARPLRGLAVVGLGYWGPNWIRNFYTLQCAERLVACDLSTERLGHIKSVYPSVEVTQKFDDILADPRIDGIVIATPVSTHYQLAKRGLEADKAVVVEKPLATSRTA